MYQCNILINITGKIRLEKGTVVCFVVAALDIVVDIILSNCTQMKSEMHNYCWSSAFANNFRISEKYRNSSFKSSFVVLQNDIKL